MPPTKVSYVPMFLACLMATLTILGVVAATLILIRPGSRKGPNASSAIHRETALCETYTRPPAGERCGIKHGSLWSYCHALKAPAACKASNICGFAGNGDCVVTALDANDALTACSRANAASCASVQFPSCCQCDCAACENESGCGLAGLTASCARANTPDECLGAGAACKWYC